MEAKDVRQILVIDTETTGFDPKADTTIEVACTLYNIIHAAPVQSFASLIRAANNPAEHVNRISVDLLQTIPDHWKQVWGVVRDLAEQANVIVAHRADFDIQFVDPPLRALRPWACSKYDMDWVKGRPQRGDDLVHLALAHGVPIVSAHRAMADVDTLVRTFQAAQALGQDVAEMVARSLRPKALFIALVPYAEKDKAKQVGFQWTDSDKTWSRTMFLDEAAKLPFKTKQVKT
jgi:DNA polymerase-3 subunit epsilon